MYLIYTANKKSEKILSEILSVRQDIRYKLDALKIEPRRSNGAHKLHGRFSGKWACWFGSNIRVIYSIDDDKKIVFIEAVGSHKIY